MDELQNRVYPRAYGGTLARDLVYSAAVGLSPRVRGNLLERRHLYHGLWSIPARTGEPLIGAFDRAEVLVYPRAYGGTTAPYGLKGTLPGLSPRVRGNPERISEH